MRRKVLKNTETVLQILRDEINRDVKSALKKITDDYSMTWMYKSRDGILFPTTGKNIEEEIDEVYRIEDRKYDIKNIAEGKDVVIVEMVESYTDPESKQVYRTPLVIVLELKNGRIKTGRHYCDPRVSYLGLSDRDVDKVFK